MNLCDTYLRTRFYFLVFIVLIFSWQSILKIARKEKISINNTDKYKESRIFFLLKHEFSVY